MNRTICALLASMLLAATASAAAAQSGVLLVLNKSEDTVSFLDLASGKAVASIPTGVGPHEVALSPDGKTAVIADYGDQARPGNALTVIDVPNRRSVKTISLGENRRPHGIVWWRDDAIVVTTEGSKALLIVDVASGRVTDTIPTDQNISHMVALAPKHERAFIANIGSGSVTVVDLKARRRIANIPTGEGAEGIDVSPDQTEVWVTNRGANTISVLDAATLKVIATLESKDFPIRVKFTPDGAHALVSNAKSGDVAVFDTKARKEIRRIAMQASASENQAGSRRLFGAEFGSGPVPVGILIVPELQRAFVANTNADIVSVIDLMSWTIVDRLEAGKEPDGLGYSAISIR